LEIIDLTHPPAPSLKDKGRGEELHGSPPSLLFREGVRGWVRKNCPSNTKLLKR